MPKEIDLTCEYCIEKHSRKVAHNRKGAISGSIKQTADSKVSPYTSYQWLSVRHQIFKTNGGQIRTSRIYPINYV